MLVAAIGFGSTFSLVRIGLTQTGPYQFVAVRFLFAAAILWLIARNRPRSAGVWKAAAWPGIWLLLGYIFQTVGLQYVNGPVSAFITYMLVVIVPLLAAVISRRLPKKFTSIGALLAVIGLWVMSGAQFTIGEGDLLTLGCAIAFAANIVAIDRVAHFHDVLRFTAAQMTVVGLGALPPALAYGRWSASPTALFAIFGTALIASVIAFVLQVWGQRQLDPSRVAVLLMVEPVFAAALGTVLGARLTFDQIGGAGLVLAAVLVSELAGYRNSTVAS